MAQLTRELELIARLDLAGYFLVVWDVCRFCRESGILVQGRGSAANSAVCYVLGITAVDPVGMDLLFERFLSEERGTWPDIDLDLPSGDQREEVIQYVYRRYGRHAAAMTANVITYRRRSAVREVGKVLGLSERILAGMPDAGYGGGKGLSDAARDAGLDRSDRRVKLLIEITEEIQHLPRHLGQHSGGMIIAAGRLDEIVPLQPASMPGRTVIQWDKDDCGDLGIIKVDLLGLGMLRVLEEAIPLVRAHEGVDVDLARLPQDDPQVYKLLQQADTVGLFQVESRAQMATLPRMKPRCFYDLVVEVAIIRPGPIVGRKVHPYLRRRAGKEAVTYPHPSLEPILRRTLGIPLFQEQAMRIAMQAAGFSVRQAEELRRAMTHKRSFERKAKQEQALRDGLKKRGIEGEAAEEILRSLDSFFGLYGFPESHAASFALIVYASAYLKAHHPAAFLCAMLNAWPLGFYHPATLIKDAKRHRQTVRPVDVNRSGFRCRIEPDGAVRLGLRYVVGLREEAAGRIEAEQARSPFSDTKDFQRRCRLRGNELNTLAELGAFASLGLRRREALWQVSSLYAGDKGLLARLSPKAGKSPLREMSPEERTAADYKNASLTTGPHPLAHLRKTLRERGVLPAAALQKQPDGRRVKVAGVVITRQRPQTARGMCFLTLEDESGLCNVVVTPDQFDEHRLVLVTSSALIVEGFLQRRDGVTHLRGRRFEPLTRHGSTPPSRDFR
jgi:error-prone DNA polymerase